MKNKIKMFLLLISIFFVFMISYNVKAAITIIDEQHIDGLIGKIEYDSS